VAETVLPNWLSLGVMVKVGGVYGNWHSRRRLAARDLALV
jgi:hypothetical protein